MIIPNKCLTPLEKKKLMTSYFITNTENNKFFFVFTTGFDY